MVVCPLYFMIQGAKQFSQNFVSIFLLTLRMLFLKMWNENKIMWDITIVIFININILFDI